MTAELDAFFDQGFDLGGVLLFFKLFFEFFGILIIKGDHLVKKSDHGFPFGDLGIGVLLGLEGGQEFLMYQQSFIVDGLLAVVDDFLLGGFTRFGVGFFQDFLFGEAGIHLLEFRGDVRFDTADAVLLAEGFYFGGAVLGEEGRVDARPPQEECQADQVTCHRRKKQP